MRRGKPNTSINASIKYNFKDGSSKMTRKESTHKTSPSLHGDRHGWLYGIAKGGVEDRSFPSTSIVVGSLSWFYSSLLHLAPGSCLGSSLFFDAFFCGCFSLYERKVCCKSFSAFFLFDSESCYMVSFFCFWCL